MAFVTEKHEKWLKFNHMEATVMEALDMLNELESETKFKLKYKGWTHSGRRKRS